MPKAKKDAKKSDGLILYQGNGEVLVTTPAHEKKMLKEWFCEGERDPSDYDRSQTSWKVVLIQSGGLRVNGE